MISDLRPYPAMKDSGVPWLGEVPSHWDVLPALAAYQPKQVKNTGMIEKTVLSLSFGRIVIKPEEKLRGLVPESFETYQVVDPGDIIVRTTDLQNDQKSLRIGFSTHRGIITSAYACLRTTDRVSDEFGYQFLNAYDRLKIIYGYGSGLRQNLDFADIKRMPVLVPPLQEQAAIVRFLDHADRRIWRYIRAKQKLIALLGEEKQAIIHGAVTHGLDPEVRRRPSGVEWMGNVPEEWGIWQVGYLARVGNGSTPSRGNLAYWSGGTYPWLNSSSVNRGRILNSDQFVTDLALRECHLPRVQPGSVLIAITGQGKTRGTAAILETEATINQHIAFITPRSGILATDYLHLAMTGAYRELRRISDDAGSTKGALTCADIVHFKVAIPPREQQSRIVARVHEVTADLDATVERVAREIDLVREYRTRLIADVVTGKIDVLEVAAQLRDEVDESLRDAELVTGEGEVLADEDLASEQADE